MLKLDPRKIENFSDEDLVSLLEAGGWEPILPQNLTDTRLLSLAGQFRKTLGGTGSKAPYEQGRAALAMAMFLVANARGSNFAGDCDFDLDRDMEVLRGVLVVSGQPCHLDGDADRLSSR